ncbi:MAG: MFS transporter [Dehalococcoidales bacterium]|nr:MFS transporter [Dehalococcoidales bacterium]
MANPQSSPVIEVRTPRLFYGNIIVLFSFIIQMIAWGTQFSFGVFLKTVSSEFEWTRAAISGAYAVNTLLIGVFGIFAGKLSDRYGPRLVLTVCGLLTGLGYLLMSQINAIWQMYLLYGVLISAGMACIWVPLIAMITRWFVRRRGFAIGIVASGTGIGIAIMPPLADYLISNYSWRISYVIVGIIMLGGTILAAQFLKRDPGQIGLSAYGADPAKTGSLNLEHHGVSVQEAFRDRRFWIISTMFFCSNYSLQAVFVHIVPHATDIGIASVTAATIMSILGFIAVGGKLGMGGIIDRIGNKRVAITYFLLFSVAFFWLLAADELWMFYLFAVIFAVGWAGFAVLQAPIIAEYFGLRALGTIFGLATFATQMGGAVGSFLTGFIFDVSGSYHPAFIICGVLGIIGMTLSVILKAAK